MELVFCLITAAALFGSVRLCIKNAKENERPVVRFLQAAVSGVIVYYFVQSAVERRFVLSLLLPAAEGAFAPVRLAVLLLCIEACLYLSASKTGKTLSDGLVKACRKRWGRWICALAVTGLFFVWSIRVNVLSYLTMDDVTILHSIAAIPEEGLSAAAGAWSNIILCGLIGFFYKIAPEGYWYLGYHLFVLTLSLVIIGRCILVKTEKSGHSPLAGLAVHMALCVGVFSYAFGGISFTLTPAVAGAAAVALVLCREDEDSLPALLVSDVSGVLLMLLCRLQRYSTMQAVICFWALAAAYSLAKLLLRRSGMWKKSAASLGVSVILTLILCFGNLSAGLPTVSAEYRSAEYYRSVVMDYLMDNLTDEQWEAVGIPPELAIMMRGWYFMDERVSTETFRELTELYYETGAVATEANVMGTNAVSETMELVRKNILPIAAGMLLAAASAVVGFLQYGKRRWPELLCALFAVGGAGLLCLYLLHEGRFPLRVFLVVAIPACVTLAIMLLSFREPDTPKKKGLRVISIVPAAALCVCLALSAMGSPRADRAVTRQELFSEQWSMEDYAGEHSGLMFYTNMTDVTLDPLHGAYTYPQNISVWGGSFFTVDDDHPCADAFFREDTRLMVKPLSSLAVFLQYLTVDFGPVQAELEARLADGICVVRISRVIPENAPDGWFEANGMTYYLENGKAVSGQLSVGGEEYDFTPKGLSASLVTLRTEDGAQIYTTDACGLIAGN